MVVLNRFLYNRFLREIGMASNQNRGFAFSKWENATKSLVFNEKWVGSHDSFLLDNLLSVYCTYLEGITLD
jgi:hypothetical protein